MKRDIKYNQMRRKQRRMKEKQRKRRKIALFGLVLVISFSFIFTSYFGKNQSAEADDANIVAKDDLNYKKRQTASKGDSQIQPVGEEVAQESKEMPAFSNQLIAYMKTNKEVYIYESPSKQDRMLLTVGSGEYIKTYGQEDGWTKVSHKTVEGYVSSEGLDQVEDKYLKVINGQLVVTKDYLIPEDFDTSFDLEAESSMLVMIEAMRREGIEVNIGRKYTSFEDEKAYITNDDSAYSLPDPYNSELRTGLAFEIHSPNTDPRLDNDFNQSEAGQWLKNNAYKFGFIQRYPHGKEDITGFKANDYIYRFMGYDIAKDMFEENMTVEEYFK